MPHFLAVIEWFRINVEALAIEDSPYGLLKQPQPQETRP
jgi:hypothetical protein